MGRLTITDLDEWAGLLDATTYADGKTYPSFFPYDWARAALGELLGEEIPFRRYEAAEMRGLLVRARAVASPATWVQEAML